MRTQNETKVKNNSYIGVDVANATLDAHRFPENLSLQFANTPEGWKQFLQWIKDEPPTLVLCEATGGYEKNFVLALADSVPYFQEMGNRMNKCFLIGIPNCGKSTLGRCASDILCLPFFRYGCNGM